MAVTRTTKRAAAKKAPTRKAPARKAAAKRGKTNPGDSYTCEVCGLAVTVDEACGCSEAHELICCSEPMKKVGARR